MSEDTKRPLTGSGKPKSGSPPLTFTQSALALGGVSLFIALFALFGMQADINKAERERDAAEARVVQYVEMLDASAQALKEKNDILARRPIQDARADLARAQEQLEHAKEAQKLAEQLEDFRWEARVWEAQWKAEKRMVEQLRDEIEFLRGLVKGETK